MGESNAESVMREEAIQQDLERLKRTKKTKRKNRNIQEKQSPLTNHAQEIRQIDNLYLYPNQNKRVAYTTTRILV
jgi:hypothetical protein